LSPSPALGNPFFSAGSSKMILLQTKARVVVVDPNSFRSIALSVSKEKWKKASYDIVHRSGFLPSEASNFKRRWNCVDGSLFSSVRIWTRQNAAEARKVGDQLGDISPEVLSGDMGPVMEDEIRRCHGFVGAVSNLMRSPSSSSKDVIDVSRQLPEKIRDKPQKERVEVLRAELPRTPQSHFFSKLFDWFSRRLYLQAASHSEYIEGDGTIVLQHAQNFRSAALMRKTANSQTTLDDPRLHVIDLPSLKEFRFRACVVSTILSCEWIRAEQSWESALSEPSKNDRRVPTFIVVDEAHNFISAEPRNHSEKGLREQFRRIAAEGRKFGFFLIVVSQRLTS
jgi:hypothetical protein